MSLTFLTWNLENFFLAPTTLPQTFPKSKEKIKKIAKVFKETDPEVAFLVEVGGRESLEIFNKDYLENKYKVSLFKGNSNRGIELGFLIKQDFLTKHKLIFDHIGHARKPIQFLYPHETLRNKKAMIKGEAPPHRSHFLSRDLAELRFYRKDDHLKVRPVLAFLGVHLKSKLDKEGIDWQGKRRRQAEAAYLASIFKKREEKWRGKTPIFITGDFNGECHRGKRDEEFRDLYHLEKVDDFTDILDLPREECISFVGIDKNKRSFGLQLDYFFFHQKWKDYLQKEHSGFYRYKSLEGRITPLPQNPGAKHALPSDHYPLITEWEEDILKNELTRKSPPLKMKP